MVSASHGAWATASLARFGRDGLLAQAVAAAAPGAPEGGRHGRDPAAGRRGARAHGGGLAVLLPPGRDVGLEVAAQLRMLLRIARMRLLVGETRIKLSTTGA